MQCVDVYNSGTTVGNSSLLVEFLLPDNGTPISHTAVNIVFLRGKYIMLPLTLNIEYINILTIVFCRGMLTYDMLIQWNLCIYSGPVLAGHLSIIARLLSPKGVYNYGVH